MNSLRNFFKKGIVYVWLLVILVSVLGFLLGKFVYRSVHDEELLNLQSRAKTVALLIRQDNLASLSATSTDASNPDYLSVKSLLTQIRNYYQDTRFVYVVELADDKAYFIADSEDPSSDAFSPPGQEYTEAPIGLMSALKDGAVNIEGPYTDRWGSWISAFVPIRAADGTVEAAVGIDIDAAAHKQKIFATLTFVTLITGFFIAVIFIVYHFGRREEEIIRVKSDFIALASHELRSPLTAIRWKLDMMLNDESLSEQMKTDLKNMRLSALRLITMSNSILETTATDRDLIEDKIPHKADLALVIKGAVTGVEDAARNKKITINIPTELLTAGPDAIDVRGEADKLELAFTNLLSNAIKYSPENTVVDIVYGDFGSKKVISVSDHGIGIPADEAKYIFHGFYRAKNAQDTGNRGSGFGLYMTRKIFEFFGGKIECKSVLQKGTTFVVTLVSASE